MVIEAFDRRHERLTMASARHYLTITAVVWHFAWEGAQMAHRQVSVVRQGAAEGAQTAARPSDPTPIARGVWGSIARP